MNVLGVGAPAPASLSSSALHFRLKVTNILPPSPIYHSRTVVREPSHLPETGLDKQAIWPGGDRALGLGGRSGRSTSRVRARATIPGGANTVRPRTRIGT